MPESMEHSIARGVEAFGTSWRPERTATAPGRLELLGNHVDYNGGLVLAGAIDRTIRAVSGTGTAQAGRIRLHAPDVSTDVETVVCDTPAPPDHDGTTTPGDYLAGIVEALNEAELPVRCGQDIVVSGDVPVGFGMKTT